MKKHKGTNNSSSSTLDMAQFANKKQLYQYKRIDNYPPYLQVVPDRERVPRSTRKYLRNAFFRCALNTLLVKMLSIKKSNFLQLKQFNRLYKLLPKPSYSFELWNQDDFFSYSFLAGTNANCIQQCKQIPDHLCRESIGKEKISADLSVLEAAEQGLIFLVDLSALGSIHCVKSRVMMGSYTFFYKDPDNHRLNPIAILLESPQKERFYFTKKHGFWPWMTAKAYVLNGSNFYHQVIPHFMESHLVPELLAISFQRTIPEHHPLYSLLWPHLQHSIGINTVARRLLISSNGMIDHSMSGGAKGVDQLIKQTWPTWQWDEHTFKNDLLLRNVMDHSTIEDYPYRDDGLLVYDAIKEFVKDYLALCYQSDEEIIKDTFLQSWLSDLSDQRSAGIKGLPLIDTLYSLTNFITECIFKASALHSAMQENQYQQYGYIPYTAAGLYQKPIHEYLHYNEKFFLKTLPTLNAALSQIASAFVLNRPVKDSLIDYAKQGTQVEFLSLIYKKFYQQLNRITAIVEERNTNRPVKYYGFYPPHISNYVEI